MSRDYAPISSLENMCIYEISKNFVKFKSEMEYLPTQIKDKFLRIASHRLNTLEDIDLLKSLIHPYVVDISFLDCAVNDKMLHIVQECPRLRKLQMCKYSTLTFEGCANLFPKLSNLEYFIARKCDVIDDKLIDIMAVSCQKITTLDLSNCKKITNLSMSKLKNLKLSALTISGTNISDEGITNLVQGKCAETISELNVTRCPVTDKSYSLVIEKCKKIEIFTLKDTKFTGNISTNDSTNLKQLTWTVF